MKTLPFVTIKQERSVVLLRALFLLLIYLVIVKLSSAQKVQGTTNLGNTVVWIIRHAEKEAHPTKYQPQECLSRMGNARASAFADFVTYIDFDAYYTSSNTLTTYTIKPLLDKRKAQPTRYNEYDLIGLSKDIITNHKGKTSLVVCKMEDMLELVEVFGGRRPLPKMRYDDYHFIFKLTILPNDEVVVHMDQYHPNHHLQEE